LELHHPDHTSRDAIELISIAEENDLFTTSGSDFHGMYAKNPVPIGYGCAPACKEIIERI
jgi:hypothetical protein